MRKIKSTGCKSYCLGKLAEGCKQCVKGRKSVLFITGLCGMNCYYCPISDKKANKDVMYINERKVDSYDEILEEIKISKSTGVGITGGDPLAVMKRTCEIIKLLKKTFGKDFHIHLYTPMLRVNENNIKKLEKAGLDEIRFHLIKPDNKIKIKTSMKKGVEVPVIPGTEKEMKKLINFIKDDVEFLNLNELEVSDTNICKITEKGFECKNEISYAVKGSEELAKKLLDYCKNTSLDVHYCTVSLKDSVQLINRLKIRAKSIALSTDKITKDGTLIRGVIYLKELVPSFNFQKKLDKINKEKYLEELEIAKHKLDFTIYIDDRKLRLLTSKKNILKHKDKIKSLGFVPAIVEELGSYDQFEIESEEF